MKPILYYIGVVTMLLLMALALARVATACPATQPPGVPPAQGKGWWQADDCSWVVVPCTPASEFTPERVVRLPQGCPVLAPRLGYTVQQSTDVRADLARAAAELPLLKQEVTTCRDHADKAHATDTKLLGDCTQTRGRLRHDLEGLQQDNSQLIRTNQDLKEALFWSPWKIGGMVMSASALGWLAGHYL